MCIVADSVIEVAKTKIACFQVGFKIENSEIMPSQLTVYSAEIDSTTESNALILPVYNPGNDILKLFP